ncbi:hypothetical protein BRC97_07100 [Halobacteriales archaeon QS_6_71_20]|nr:MAG: hypothetical protein BRC97_07100 [Halobacteriales archaeon QS_6_71_20]
MRHLRVSDRGGRATVPGARRREVCAVRYCPSCGARLVTRTPPGSGIPRRVCPECSGGDRDA